MQPAGSSCSISYCTYTKTFTPVPHSLASWSWWGPGSWKHTIEKLSKWDVKCLESWWLYFSELLHKTLIVLWCSKRKVLWAVLLTKAGFLWTDVLKILSSPRCCSCVPVAAGMRVLVAGSCFQAGYIMIVFCLPFLQWDHQFWSPFSA